MIIDYERHKTLYKEGDEFYNRKGTRENRKKKTLSNLCSRVGKIFPVDNSISFPMLSGTPLILQVYRSRVIADCVTF